MGADPANPEESLVLATPKEFRRAVRGIAERGSDCAKVYDRLSRETDFAIVDEARRQKLPVVGTPASQ
ncbi:MAG TPA: hypothetical protein VIY96_02450 [Thermoanaerobaculia bacterium]